MKDSTFVTLQHIIPKLALTQFAGWVAGAQWGALTQWIIRRFIRKYQVNMAEAAQPSPRAYATFNDFFTRALRADARPLAPATWVSPVDGAISQLGAIEADQIFQAKGHHYSTRALLGGDAALAAQFESGHFACIYLSPRDYHRIHMPCDGVLRQMVYVPGELFSVNPATARGVPGLFARNERLVCVFDTPHGPFVNVLVGATIVGSMATVWHGLVNPPRSKTVRSWVYDSGTVVLKQGDEMGRFLLGSTVVMLWPKQPAGQGFEFNTAWAAGGAVRLGEAMADIL